MNFDLEKTFRLTAEVSSVALLIGFVTSSTINQIVFSSWGLDFASYATPSDVIMSGIGLLLDVSLPIVIALVVFIGPRLLSERYAGNRSFSLIFIVFVAALALLSYPFLLGLSERANADRLTYNGTRFADAYHLTVLLLALAISVIVILVRRGKDPEGRRRGWVVPAGLVTVIVAMLCTANIVRLRAELGYQRVLTEAVTSEAVACPTGAFQVLWIGSEWMITRCEGRAITALPQDQVRRIVLSDKIGVCDSFGFVTLWSCSVRLRGPAVTDN